MTHRPVLILGATSDIGKAIAHGFAKQGRPIQLAARNTDGLDADCQDLNVRYQVEATVHRFDALAPDSFDQFFDDLPECPSVVVSVVGLLLDQAETERDIAAARLTADTNFLGPIMALEKAAARLSELPDETAIIGISSVAGDRGRAKNYWYGASKAAFTTALSGLRQKYAGTNLHVMTVKPGFVDTKMTEGMKLIRPLTAKPEDIARLVVNGLKKHKRIVVPWKWQVIMTGLRLLPERVFERVRI